MPRDKPVELFRAELIDLTKFLIRESLVDDQNMAIRRDVGGGRVNLESPYWNDEFSAPDLLSKVSYSELYAGLVDQRAYDLKFLDGGLVQLRFEFDASRPWSLIRACSAYFPSPDLTPYQTDPEIYLRDEVFGSVVDLRAVTTPLRFDFDAREGVPVDLHHPVSHVTFGLYPHCRIAAAGPITPYYFIEFLLRAFYRTRDWLATHDGLPSPRVAVPRTITSMEESLMHFGVPTQVNA